MLYPLSHQGSPLEPFSHIAISLCILKKILHTSADLCCHALCEGKFIDIHVELLKDSKVLAKETVFKAYISHVIAHVRVYQGTYIFTHFSTFLHFNYIF